MQSPLVIVYHRQPYEEVEEDGRIVYKENRSPNGIVPTLKSFFGAVDHGSWIAESLRGHVDPVSTKRSEIDDAYATGISVVQLALDRRSRFHEFYMLPRMRRSGTIFHCFCERLQLRAPSTGPKLPRGELGLSRSRARKRPGGLVWVHVTISYGFRVSYISARYSGIRVILHHTPLFPRRDVFNMLPCGAADSIGAFWPCDYVGFHIPR